MRVSLSIGLQTNKFEVILWKKDPHRRAVNTQAPAKIIIINTISKYHLICEVMKDDKEIWKQVVYPVIGACQEVHKQLGPFLNEYMYQEALAIELDLRKVEYDKEYYFSADYKGHAIQHRHFADFRVKNGDVKILVECKAVDALVDMHRQQLWNYMRLTGIRYGVLYNFAPVYSQCEKYYYDDASARMIAF